MLHPPAMAATLDDLLVFQKARSAGASISALLRRPSLVRDGVLHEQMNRASISVVSNIAEGFGQKSDAHFAKFLFSARGSAEELRAQLSIAADRGYLTKAECEQLREQFAEVTQMLSGLIYHLQRSRWHDRRR